MAKKKKSFAEMMEELEEILRHLEQGDQELEGMLKLYTKGIELSGLCRAKLNAAEDAIQEGVPELKGEENAIK